MKELNQLKEFYINNNLISEEFDVSWLPDSLLIIDCSANSLTGDINMNKIPTNTVSFICSDNDFATLTWEYIPYSTTYQNYKLQKIVLMNAKLTSVFDMKVLANDGEYTNLKTIALSNNDLNVSIKFEYLESTQIEYFDIRNTSHYGSVDFQYLTDSIEILMDVDVRCVPGYCTYVSICLWIS